MKEKHLENKSDKRSKFYDKIKNDLKTRVK
jgi:hypothetical protein